jgi:hypothetical protein
MKLMSEHNKLSLPECRKAIGKESINYSDEQLIKIRDWLDNIADIALAIIEKNGIDNINEIIDREKHNQDEST